MWARIKDWFHRRRQARSCREYAILCGRTHDFAEMNYWFDLADQIEARRPLPIARSLPSGSTRTPDPGAKG